MLACTFHLAFFLSLPPRFRGESSLTALFPLTAGCVIAVELWAIARDLHFRGAPAAPAAFGGAAPRRARPAAARSLLDLRPADFWRWDDAASFALAAGAVFLALCLFCACFSPRPPVPLLRALRGGALACEVARALARGSGRPAAGALLAPLAALGCSVAAWGLLRASAAVPVEAAWGALAAAAAEALVLARAAGLLAGKQRAP